MTEDGRRLGHLHILSWSGPRLLAVCDCGASCSISKREYDEESVSCCPKCAGIKVLPKHQYRPFYLSPIRELGDHKGVCIGKVEILDTLGKEGALYRWKVKCHACKKTSETNSRSLFGRRKVMGFNTDCGCTSRQEAAQRALQAAERKRATKNRLAEQAAYKAARAQEMDLTGRVFANFEVVRGATAREAKKGSGIGRMWVIQCRVCQATYVRSTAVLGTLKTTHCGKCHPAPAGKRKRNIGQKRVVARKQGAIS